jgi:hypothetical protein
MKKTTMYVSLVACLMFAGVATADPVVYELTSDEGLAGTITIDVGNPDSSGGGEDEYSYGAGITAFSIFQPTTPAVTFGPEDITESWFFLTVILATADDSAIGLEADIDNFGGGNLFGVLDFSLAVQSFDTQPGDITNAALTPVDGGPTPVLGTVLIIK